MQMPNETADAAEEARQTAPPPPAAEARQTPPPPPPEEAKHQRQSSRGKAPDAKQTADTAAVEAKQPAASQ